MDGKLERKVQERRKICTGQNDTRLKKGKTYFVCIRAYKKASGKKIYSEWSKVKKAKMK